MPTPDGIVVVQGFGMYIPGDYVRAMNRISLVLIVFAAAGIGDVRAQSDQTIGLALSGGGARGFAHIGVLRVLEEEGVPIHVIAGTSIGSIIGGLYAIGYTPDDLERVGAAQDWEELFAVSAPRQRRPVQLRTLENDFLLTLAIRDGQPALPSSLVSGQRVSTLLTRLTLPFHATRDFVDLPIAFAAVATDLETGEALRLTKGHLSEAIRASVSIPSALAPVRISGRTLIDGAVARNLPAEDARALGADVVICIDTGRELQPAESLHSMTDVLNQALGFQIEEHVKPQKEYCDLYLKPWLNNATVIDFGKIDDLISLGYASADSARDRFRALAGGVGTLQQRDTTAVERIRDEKYVVSRVRVQGIGPRDERRVVSAVSLHLPAEISPSQLEAAVDRIYASGPYRQVMYRMLPDSAGTAYTLLLDIDPHPTGRLGIDARYDSRYKASLLLSGTGRKRVGYGPTVRVSLRLGELASLAAGYIMPLTYGRTLSLGLDGALMRTPFDRFEGSDRIEQFIVDAAEFRSFIGAVPIPRWSVSAGMRAEYFRVRDRFGAGLRHVPGEAGIGPEAVISHDSHDRSIFPTRGHRVIVHLLASVHPTSSATFSRMFVDWQPRWYMTENMSMIGRLSFGTSSGELPLHHRFFLGGTFEQPVLRSRLIPLYGAGTQQLSGTHVQAVAAGLQIRLNDEWFLSGLWNAGSTDSGWLWVPSSLRPGIGISIGRQTFLFPAVLTISTRGFEGPYAVTVNLGHTF